MELTRKSKDNFEEWYRETYGYPSDLKQFYKSVDSMKYGVYVDFFDSVGIRLFTHDEFAEPLEFGFKYSHSEFGTLKPVGIRNKHETRPEARTLAIKRANEIYNGNNSSK